MSSVATSPTKRNFFSSPFASPMARIRDVLSDLDHIPPMMVRTAAMDHGTSPAVMRVTLERLARHVDVVHGDCYPTRKALGGATRFDPTLGYCGDTVRKAVNALAALGLVQRLRGASAWAVYLEREPNRDLRNNAYVLTAWVRRHGLKLRNGVVPKLASKWARSRARESAKAEARRKYSVSRQVARKLARDAGIDLDQIVGGIVGTSEQERKDRRSRARVMPEVPVVKVAAQASAPQASKGVYQSRADRVETTSSEPNLVTHHGFKADLTAKIAAWKAQPDPFKPRQI